MVQAIDSSSTSTTYTTSSSSTTSDGAAAAALQAQLEQYQHQLSDCVNCSSASTPEGKHAIAEISSKISSLKHVIESSQQKAPAASSSNRSDRTKATEKAQANPLNPTQQVGGVNANQTAQQVQNQISTDAVRPVVAPNLTVGVNVNVYS
ncbi:hypothetical protein ACO0K2_07660 [Undibacterium sp. MH2W]|uniref:hypothetical protein n=1 Tax=Undibacterium sp. MH2W TaxID=3413044 RepID=UPI003BF07D6F